MAAHSDHVHMQMKGGRREKKQLPAAFRWRLEISLCEKLCADRQWV